VYTTYAYTKSTPFLVLSKNLCACACSKKHDTHHARPTAEVVLYKRLLQCGELVQQHINGAPLLTVKLPPATCKLCKQLITDFPSPPSSWWAPGSGLFAAQCPVVGVRGVVISDGAW
jgi:hypothetical protein